MCELNYSGTVAASISGSANCNHKLKVDKKRLGRQDLMKSSRSALIVSASVVGMPCGKPL